MLSNGVSFLIAVRRTDRKTETTSAWTGKWTVTTERFGRQKGKADVGPQVKVCRVGEELERRTPEKP